MPATISVKTTLGSILLGCLLSVALSGVVAAQSFLYFKLYPHDHVRIKLIVWLVWGLDAVHACLISSASWEYLILNFGDSEIPDHITTSVALTVVFTALVTFVVHLFFSHRVFSLSKKNWWITMPLIILTILRLVAALVTTVQMSRLQSFSIFVAKFGWCFTTGLALAAALDILIAGSLCYFLQTNRTGFGRMDEIINVIMLYTFNNGALTCITTVVAMICWLSMKNNLVFLGLYFAISKLYANSLLATLNTRKTLRGRSQHSGGSDHPMPVLFPDSFNRRGRGTSRHVEQNITVPAKVQISVEKTVEYDLEGGSGSARDMCRPMSVNHAE